MRALITGAGGFVGRHLSSHLSLDLGFEVVGIESKPRPTNDHARLLVCDLMDADLTGRVMRRHQPDLIFHLAAQTYVPRAFVSPADTLVNNIVAQVNVLEACRASEINPVILVVGSAEQYGQVEPDALPITEEQSFRPTNPYAVSKVTQDLLGLQYFLSYGMKIVRVRPSNHIGPGQSDRFALSSFARQIAEAETGRSDPVILVGNLDAKRDFLDVRDVVRAYAKVTQPEFAGQVFNVASGIPRSIQEMLDMLVAESTVPISIQQDPARMRPVDVPLVVGDSTKLRAALDWRPEISLTDSIRDTLNYWRSELGAKA